MRTLAEIVAFIQSEFNDTSSGIQTQIYRLVNQGLRKIRGYTKWRFSEKTTTTTTTASTQSYDLPIDFRALAGAPSVTVGGVEYFPRPIESRSQWDRLNADAADSLSDIPLYYTIIRNKLFLWPTPSSSSNTITYNYIANPQDYADAHFSDYTTGTITLTNASAAVVGSGTTFAATHVGRYLRGDVDGQWYKISAFTDTTHITLERTFQGTTGSTLAYKIGTLPDYAVNYPDLIDALGYYVLQALWRKREEFSAQGGLSTHFKLLYDEIMKDFKKEFNQSYSGPGVEYVEFGNLPANPNLDPTNLASS